MNSPNADDEQGTDTSLYRYRHITLMSSYKMKLLDFLKMDLINI